MIAETLRQSVDSQTGQQLFRPQTGKSAQGREQEVRSEGGISNYLYNKHKMKEQAQKQQKLKHEQAYTQRVEAEKDQAKNKISEMLLEQKINQQLEELFSAFDADQNGYITSEEVNLDLVSAQILEIFTPLFVEMENLNETLTREEFCASAYNLYQVSQ